jgi:hypothetical protein
MKLSKISALQLIIIWIISIAISIILGSYVKDIYLYGVNISQFFPFFLPIILFFYTVAWYEAKPINLEQEVQKRFKKINFAKLFKEYFEDEIDPEELSEEKKWQYLGEIDIFKDLSAGKLDAKLINKENYETQLFVIFPHIKDKKREELANKLKKIFKN